MRGRRAETPEPSAAPLNPGYDTARRLPVRVRRPQIAVTTDYRLWVSANEKYAMRRVLQAC